MDFKEEHKISPDSFSKDSFDRYVLTADVGGTYTDFAVFGVRDRGVTPIVFLHFSSKDISDFKDAVNESLRYSKDTYDIEISDACFGVAGPLFDDRQLAKITNLGWDIDTRHLKGSTLLEHIILINDFEAIGFGIAVLDDTDIETLPHADGSTPSPQERETKAVIGAGTGLGEGILYYTPLKDGYVPLPSEGGHCDLAPRGDLQRKLVEYLIDDDLCGGSDFPDWESVLSGRGITSIFRFIKGTDLSADDTAENIAIRAAEGEATCQKTMSLFFELYGQESAALALKVKALGGVYIAGGIAAKNLDLLKKGEFMTAFDGTRAPDHPLHELITQVPVFIIKNYDVSLYGAANAAANFIDLY